VGRGGGREGAKRVLSAVFTADAAGRSSLPSPPPPSPVHIAFGDETYCRARESRCRISGVGFVAPLPKRRKIADSCGNCNFPNATRRGERARARAFIPPPSPADSPSLSLLPVREMIQLKNGS